jgi:protein transport protein SEC61 subunit gamma and related proteins
LNVPLFLKYAELLFFIYLKKKKNIENTEFKKIALSTGMGMVVMGFVGFFVKLLHIPINNILMGV